MNEQLATSRDEAAWATIQDMLSDTGKQDPTPHYARLHELGEFFQVPGGNFWATGYEAANAVMTNLAFGKGNVLYRRPTLTNTTPEQEAEIAEIFSDASPNLVMLDPPDHTRVRGLVQRSFMPAHLRAVEAAISTEIDRLLAGIDPTQPVDIISSFSAIFAPNIMAVLIGLPTGRREEVSRLTSTFLRGQDPTSTYETRRTAALASRKHRDYVREIIADRRAHPQDDLVSALSNNAGELNDAELVTLIQVLYQGGYETTAHMVGNGLVALLNNPDQFARLRDDHSLMKGAVDEMLRFDGAISMSQMLALQDVELRGHKIAAGRTVSILLSGANRDPAVFKSPDQFDITRTSPQHLAFARGLHFCLGNNLAKFELERVFDALLTRFPDMRLLDQHPRRSPTFHQRSYEKVMVLLQP